MLTDGELDAILESVTHLSDVIGSIILSFEGDLLRSSSKSPEPEMFNTWSLGIFLASEMVAKKTPPDYSQLKHIAIVTSDCGYCIVTSNECIVSAITRNANAVEVLSLTKKIERLLLVNVGNNKIDFEPDESC